MALQHPPALVSQASDNILLPTLATGLTDQDREGIEDALDRSVSANTRIMYASAWRCFEDWTRARGVPSLPAPPELVAAYLLELAEERNVGGHHPAVQGRYRCDPPLYRPGGPLKRVFEPYPDFAHQMSGIFSRSLVDRMAISPGAISM